MPRTHDEIQAAIWNDARLPPGTREVALAISFVLHQEPGCPNLWTRVRDLLGYEGLAYRAINGEMVVQWRLHDLIAEDRPRYEHGQWSVDGGGCEGPRLRPYKPRQEPYAYLNECLVSRHHPHLGDCRFTQVWLATGAGEVPAARVPVPERDNSVCGARGTIHVSERDMVTGWEAYHWFCRRHVDRAHEVKAQLTARGEPPEPIPNRGGLLPRYFAGDWAKIYARHCGKTRMGIGRPWRVPYYGVDADDWPVPGRTLIPKRPRLALVSA